MAALPSDAKVSSLVDSSPSSSENTSSATASSADANAMPKVEFQLADTAEREETLSKNGASISRLGGTTTSKRKKKMSKKRQQQKPDKRLSLLLAREMAWDPSVALSDAQTEAFAQEAHLISQKRRSAGAKGQRMREVASAGCLPTRRTVQVPALKRPSSALRKLQDDTTSRIIEREAMIEHVRALAQQRPLDTAQLLPALASTRELTILVAQDILAWREANSGFNRTFLWQGQNYLLTMVSDLNFLARDSHVSRTLGIPADHLENNPLMAATPLIPPMKKSPRKSPSKKTNAPGTSEELGSSEEQTSPRSARNSDELNADTSCGDNDNANDGDDINDHDDNDKPEVGSPASASSAKAPVQDNETATAAAAKVDDAKEQTSEDPKCHENANSSSKNNDQEKKENNADDDEKGEEEEKEELTGPAREVADLLRRELAEADLQFEERRMRTRSPSMGIFQEPSFTTSADVLERWRATAEEQVKELSSSWGLEKAYPRPALKSRAKTKRWSTEVIASDEAIAWTKKDRAFGRSTVSLDPGNIYRTRATTASPSQKRRTGRALSRRRPRSTAAGAVRKGKGAGLTRGILRTRLAPLSAAGLADIVNVPLPSYALSEGSIGLLSMRTTELGAPSLRLDVKEVQGVLEEDAPSSEVRLCLTALVILLAPGKAVPADLSYKSIRETLTEKGAAIGARGLVDAACRVSVSSIPKFKVLALADFLSDARFQPEKVLAHNPESVAALCALVINLVTGSPRSRRWIAHHLEASHKIEDGQAVNMEPDTSPKQQEQQEGKGESMAARHSDGTSKNVTRNAEIDPSTVSLDECVLMTNLSQDRAVYAITFFRTKEPARSLLVKCYEPVSGQEAALVIAARQIRRVCGVPRVSDWQNACKVIKARLEVLTQPQLAVRLQSASADTAELRKMYGTARAYGPHKYSISVFCRENEAEPILLRLAGARGAEAGLRFERWVTRKRVASLLYERKRLVAQEPLHAPAVVERILDHLRVTDRGMSFVRGRPPPKPEVKNHRSVMEQDPTKMSKEELAELEKTIHEKEKLVVPSGKSPLVKPADFVPRCALDPPKHSTPKYEPPPKPEFKIRKRRIPRPASSQAAVPKSHSSLAAHSSQRPATRASQQSSVATLQTPTPVADPPRPRAAEPGEFDRHPTPKELQDDSTTSSGSNSDYEEFEDDEEQNKVVESTSRQPVSAKKDDPEVEADDDDSYDSDAYSDEDEDDDNEENGKGSDDGGSKPNSEPTQKAYTSTSNAKDYDDFDSDSESDSESEEDYDDNEEDGKGSGDGSSKPISETTQKAYTSTSNAKGPENVDSESDSESEEDYDDDDDDDDDNDNRSDDRGKNNAGESNQVKNSARSASDAKAPGPEDSSLDMSDDDFEDDSDFDADAAAAAASPGPDKTPAAAGGLTTKIPSLDLSSDDDDDSSSSDEEDYDDDFQSPKSP